MANGSWKIARGKGAQLPLAIVAVLAVVLVLIGKAQSSLFDRARAELSDWTAPMLEAARVPLNGVSRWFGSIGDIFAVYQENLRLKEENARLRQWQSAALMLQDRVKRYRLLLNAVPDPALGSITAHVIGRSTRPFLDTMILDAGKTNGVHAGEAVVDPRGMIGRVVVTGQRTSWVILLTDLNSRIPVMIVPGNAQALLAGDNTRTPYLETVSPAVKIEAGDQVVTSGDGGLLPPGLPVGVVAADGDGYRVALLADATTSDEVRIVDFKEPREEPPPLSPEDLPASPPPAPDGPGESAASNAGQASSPMQVAPMQDARSARAQASGAVPGHTPRSPARNGGGH